MNIEGNIRKARIALVIIALLAAELGCKFLSGGAAPTLSSDQSSPPLPGVTEISAPSNLIQVTVTLEADRIAHADINDQGGEVSAVSAGGVEFHLSIPPGALPGDYSIRLTPVSKMDGLNLSGGLLGAVQMEPEGLIFLKPATLTITLPPDIPPEEVVPFAYQGSGESLYLYLAKLEGNKLIFQISHFSGFGGGRGSVGETSGWPSAPGGSSGSDAQQQGGDYCRQHCGKDDYDPQKMAEYFRQWFNAAIYPALKAAESDDSTLDVAGAAFLDWARQVSVAMTEQYLAKELKDGATSFLKGLANSFDQSYRRCMQVDAYQANKMLQRLREIALLNGIFGATAPAGYTLEDKKPELQSCLTFKLKIDSLVEYQFEERNDKMITQVTGDITLKLNTDTWRFDGSGTLETKQFTLEGFAENASDSDIGVECEVSYGGMQSTSVSVKDALISWEDKDKSNATVQVHMPLQPAVLMTDSAKLICWHYYVDGSKEKMEGKIPSVPTWSGGFAVVHEDRKSGDLYIFTEFETGSGQLFARFAEEKAVNKMMVTVSDTLTMDLLHTPGQ